MEQLGDGWLLNFVKEREAAAADSVPSSVQKENVDPNTVQVVDPNSQQDSDPDDEDVADKDVTAGSLKEQQDDEAGRSRKTASSRSSAPHYSGQAGTDMRHASDQVSNSAVNAAYRSAATAADTVWVPDLQPGQSRRGCMFIDVNEVREALPQGGILSLQNAARHRTVGRLLDRPIATIAIGSLCKLQKL